MTLKKYRLRLLTGLFAVGITLISCTKAEPVMPAAISPGTTCSLDGMSLADYPGPKAQIHYADNRMEWYCDTVEMFSIYLRPELQSNIKAIFTQDMGQANWKEPRGNWIDARKAYYVYGKGIVGSMGPTFASFSSKQDAEAFAKKHKAKLYLFSEVTIEMVDLRGGAKHDRSM